MTAKRVAILDDEADIRTLVSMALTAAGFTVSEWSNGLALIEELRTGAVDVVICDLLMPDCDGVEFFATLAGLPTRPALILMSGQDARTRQSARSLAHEYGVEVIAEFGKPLDFVELEEVLVQHVANQAEAKPQSYDVDEAIDAGELVVHYQPIFSVSPHRRLALSSVEALVRWEHPSAGLVAPGEFLPQIRSEATWERLTSALLAIVCRQLQIWNAVDFDPRVAINIPPLLLANRELPKLVDEVRLAHGVGPQSLMLELTEESDYTSVLEDKAILMRLKMRGYSIGIDDYGVGHSSLKRLQGGLFDQIKIDRSFVSRADSEDEARSILASTVDLARSLGMSVCAEGVETHEVMLEALRCGCSHLQGFYLGRPVIGEMLEMQFAPDPSVRQPQPQPLERPVTIRRFVGDRRPA